jgi:hypothetical protein
MDDFPDQEEPPVGKLRAGLIGVLDRTIHPVTEAELARQAKRQRTHVQAIVVHPQGLDHGAVVIGG